MVSSTSSESKSEELWDAGAEVRELVELVEPKNQISISSGFNLKANLI